MVRTLEFSAGPSAFSWQMQDETEHAQLYGRFLQVKSAAGIHHFCHIPLTKTCSSEHI